VVGSRGKLTQNKMVVKEEKEGNGIEAAANWSFPPGGGHSQIREKEEVRAGEARRWQKKGRKKTPALESYCYKKEREREKSGKRGQARATRDKRSRRKKRRKEGREKSNGAVKLG